MMSRDNDRWLAELRAVGSERESALLDLRSALLRNLRKAMSNRGPQDEAFLEDVVQDSLLRILERLEQFQGRSRFLTWATSIAIRVAMGELRRSRWKDVSLDEVIAHTDAMGQYTLDSLSTPSGAPALGSAERQAIVETLYSLIESELTDKQRIALLAEMKGMPQDEIARHLGSNRNAVYKLTHDARKKLKKGLESAGYTAEEVSAIT